MRQKERYQSILGYFCQHQPFVTTELEYSDPYQLLVSTILSAQCTDKRVNMITPGFFKRFPEPQSLSSADQQEVFELIRSCSYPNNKSRNLIGMAKTLMEEFHGVVPSEVEDLQKLPGVGRKTANVIASVIFDKPVMAVDTHVFRVSSRLGLTKNAKNPYDAEKQLVKNIPLHQISLAHHWLILHGRYICQARKPKCHDCPLTQWCLYFTNSIRV